MKVSEYPEGNELVWFWIEASAVIAGLAFCIAVLANYQSMVNWIVEVL